MGSFGKMAGVNITKLRPPQPSIAGLAESQYRRLMPILLATLAALMTAAPAVPAPADPLTVSIETEDADRFATMFNRTNGHPTAEQIQREYLDKGSYGLSVFIPNRIVDAGHLAEAIAKKPEFYAKAIKTCLPVIKDTTADLRATYLAFKGLFPERSLPHLYLVVGADNSGGTAGPGAQVLGFETLCGMAGTPDQLREIVRGFYAHETVHTFQPDPDMEKLGGILLGSALVEGAADFVATLVTGRQINPLRASWAAPREAELWRQFEADLAVTRDAGWSKYKRGTPVAASFRRWIGNYGDAPEGWPSEMGYWMGQRIWQRWYDHQPDKRAALREMLALKNPYAVLAVGRFQEKHQPH